MARLHTGIACIILFCLFVGGCASNPAIHRGKEPTYAISSSLAPNETAICYSDALDGQRHSGGPVILKPTETGFTVQRWRYWHALIVIPVGFRNSVLIDINEAAQGSDVRIYVEPLFYGFGKNLSKLCLK